MPRRRIKQEKQTHVRAFISDKETIDKLAKRLKISQAHVIRRLIRR